MKKIILSTIMSLAMVFGFGGVMLLTTDVAQATSGSQSAMQYIDESGGSDNDQDLFETIKTVINIILGIVGVIAVAIIIIGGITYSTSQGDAGKVKKAKDTILYGVVGLVVALLAFAVVNFVLVNIFNK